jgi:2-methylcitrate dehydratase PrpD
MATRNTLATRLADWVAELDYDDIPAPAVDAAKLLILDQLGLQIHGATLRTSSRNSDSSNRCAPRRRA